jgi:hypothetical protein
MTPAEPFAELMEQVPRYDDKPDRKVWVTRDGFTEKLQEKLVELGVEIAGIEPILPVVESKDEDEE